LQNWPKKLIRKTELQNYPAKLKWHATRLPRNGAHLADRPLGGTTSPSAYTQSVLEAGEP